MTDDLIERLAADLKPVPRYAMQRLLLCAAFAGIVLSVILMLLWLGPRPDLGGAMRDSIFWIKFIYTAALGALGLPAVLALSRPGGRTVWPWFGVLGVLCALAAAAWVQLASAPPALAHELVFGATSLMCPFLIVAASAPVLAAVLGVMRRMAPTRPALAGLAAGLFSGGMGASVYSLHCTEIGLVFLLTWYSFGILTASALGAVLGKVILRW